MKLRVAERISHWTRNLVYVCLFLNLIVFSLNSLECLKYYRVYWITSFTDKFFCFKKQYNNLHTGWFETTNMTQPTTQMWIFTFVRRTLPLPQGLKISFCCGEAKIVNLDFWIHRRPKYSQNLLLRQIQKIILTIKMPYQLGTYHEIGILRNRKIVHVMF